MFRALGTTLARKLLHPTNLAPRRAQTLGFHDTRSVFLDPGGPRDVSRSVFVREGRVLTLELKKKPPKPHFDEDRFAVPGVYVARAYPTAEEIELEPLAEAIEPRLGFEAVHVRESVDVVRAKRSYASGCEAQAFYVFREGAVVVWNVPMNLIVEILALVRKFEQHSYARHVVEEDSETIGYIYNYTDKSDPRIARGYEVQLSPTEDNWEKYVTSHALAANVKVAVWERQLEKYIRNIEFITEDLKYGRKILITEEKVLRKRGAMFALRHVINLSTALLDPPELMHYTKKMDTLYRTLNNHFAVRKRLKILREKMHHCLELIQLLSSHLRDKHRLRLEWLVIGLILVELFFEGFFFFDRLLGPQESEILNRLLPKDALKEIEKKKTEHESKHGQEESKEVREKSKETKEKSKEVQEKSKEVQEKSKESQEESNESQEESKEVQEESKFDSKADKHDIKSITGSDT